MLAAEPLPPSTWRLSLRVWTWWMLVAAVAVPYIPVVAYFALRE
jgi:hypothetical protein